MHDPKAGLGCRSGEGGLLALDYDTYENSYLESVSSDVVTTQGRGISR